MARVWSISMLAPVIITARNSVFTRTSYLLCINRWSHYSSPSMMQQAGEEIWPISGSAYCWGFDGNTHAKRQRTRTHVMRLHVGRASHRTCTFKIHEQDRSFAPILKGECEFIVGRSLCQGTGKWRRQRKETIFWVIGLVGEDVEFRP